MIATVSTVKDSLANVQRFVNANLANGIDHMFVFLDARDSEVEQWLSGRPEVTLVVTDKTWWNGKRPRLLNRRQHANSNLTRAVLAQTGAAEWLFHIDADEVAQVDRAALAEIPGDDRVVRLKPLEVVSKMHWDGTPDLFKPLLDKADLELLFALGVLTEPTNSLYFRSHIIGKVGIRPSFDIGLKIHSATSGRRRRTVKATSGPGFRLLHYESFSGEDFVRKWTSMIGSGPKIHFGPHRMRVANGMKSLLEKKLAPEVTSRYLMEIYERHMADPVDLLDELGFLRRIDPLEGTHVPEPMTPQTAARLTAVLEALRSTDKTAFIPGEATPRQLAKVLRQAAA